MKIGDVYTIGIDPAEDVEWKGTPHQAVTPCIVCGEWIGSPIFTEIDEGDLIKCKCQREEGE